ncbi:MAG: hypothetical protein QM820_01465 [Minicystis sp.]
MTVEPNPYAPPAEGPAPARLPEEDTDGAPIVELSLMEAGKGRWTIRVHPQHLRFIPPDARPHRALDHHTFTEQATVVLGLMMSQLVLTGPPLRLTLEPLALADLRAWLDPVIDKHLARTLAKRRPFKVGIGSILVLLALLGAQSGPLDVPGLVVGLLWLVWSLLATVRPRRALLLVEAAIWVPFGIWPVLRVLGGGSPWNLIFVLFVVQIIAGIVKLYRFYGPVPAGARGGRAG